MSDDWDVEATIFYDSVEINLSHNPCGFEASLPNWSSITAFNAAANGVMSAHTQEECEAIVEKRRVEAQAARRRWAAYPLDELKKLGY